MMRVLVTGGAGFIGHHLVQHLLSRGDEVVVLDNCSRGSLDRPELAGAELLEGDVRDLSTCLRAVAGCTSVVHLAAISNVMGSQADPRLTEETNVAGTANVARATRSAGAHLIFASSREVYGEPSLLPVCESDRLAGKNAYGASKVAAEALLQRAAQDGLTVSVLRFTNVVGTGDSGRVLPTWLEAAHAGRPFILYGGDQVIDFVPVATAVEAIDRLVHGSAIAEPINIGSGRQTTLLKLASAIREAFGGHPQFERRPAREVEVSRFQADTTRMRTLLGIEPPEAPLAVIPEMIRALR